MDNKVDKIVAISKRIKELRYEISVLENKSNIPITGLRIVRDELFGGGFMVSVYHNTVSYLSVKDLQLIINNRQIEMATLEKALELV
jgi:hypothetical protein